MSDTDSDLLRDRGFYQDQE